MKPSPCHKAHQHGSVPYASVELMVLGCVYACYGSMVVPWANRLQARYSPAWWLIVFGPFIACYLVATLYGVWCRKRRVATASAFLNSTVLIVGLEILFVLVVLLMSSWLMLSPIDPE